MNTQKITELLARENARFSQSRPRSAELLERATASMPSGVPMAWMRGLTHNMPIYVDGGKGAVFADVDGNQYVDFNQGDMSSTTGYGTPEVTQAIADRMARGGQFVLPGEDSIWVSEELGRRFGLSHWQYTLSASAANTEAIRLARLATAREGVLMFDGSYHGHIGETLVDYSHETPQSYALGLPRDHGRNTKVVPFNNLEAAEAELAKGNTACVMAEPALSNVGLVVAQDGFFQGLREACDRHGALLIIDETHTHMFAFGGLVRHWGLKPHVVVVGKNVAGGVPIGAYGFGEDLAELMNANLFDHAGDEPGFASGGTLYGSHLSMAAARAALEHVLTEEAYTHIGRLGARLGGGIQDIIDRAGLPWRAQHLESRAGWLYGTEVPVSGVDAVRLMNVDLSDSRRIYMANRGIWEAIVTAGPAVSFPMVDADIDLYLEVAEGWIKELL